MYSKILVPLDGSKQSEHILPYARTLAKGLRLPVELLHAVEPDTVDALADSQRCRPSDVVRAGLMRSGHEYLEKVAASFKGSSPARLLVATGRPADVLVEQAERQEGTLVAMATRGHSGIKRWYLGSVADKVLHATKSPLLLVRGKGNGAARSEAAFERIIVPLDGSALAEKVIPHVLAIGKALGIEVELFRVYLLPTAAFMPNPYSPDLHQATREKYHREATTYLEGKAEQLLASGIPKVSAVTEEGEAAEKIIDMARHTPDTLIAMCTHGRSGLGRWILGSVTDRVVRHSDDPVLVVRACA